MNKTKTAEEILEEIVGNVEILDIQSGKVPDLRLISLDPESWRLTYDDFDDDNPPCTSIPIPPTPGGVVAALQYFDDKSHDMSKVLTALMPLIRSLPQSEPSAVTTQWLTEKR